MPEIAAWADACSEGGKTRRSWSTDSIADIDNPFDGESKTVGAHEARTVCFV
jgi:hypothetical protein